MIIDRDEAMLVARLRRGDAAAFDAVYEAYRPRIHGFLLRLTRDRVLADDLAQDTWMGFARAASTLRDDTDLAALLFTIARNEWRSHGRWALLDVVRVVAFSWQRAPDPVDPEERADARETGARLERALGELDPLHREVLLLVGVEGFEQDRAAAILGVSYPALRKRLARARAALAERLSALEAEPHTSLARAR
jgi:RNA polymerase sigma-70 factor (ECF subfamily)